MLHLHTLLLIEWVVQASKCNGVVAASFHFLPNSAQLCREGELTFTAEMRKVMAPNDRREASHSAPILRDSQAVPSCVRAADDAQ